MLEKRAILKINRNHPSPGNKGSGSDCMCILSILGVLTAVRYKTIDLCAGIGGIRRGFELTNSFENIISAEIEEFACRTYEHLFHENPQNDVTSDEFKNQLLQIHYDVLMAGFPCQAFSSVGLKKGFEDKTKGTIFFDIAQIISLTTPKVVFLENVANLLIHGKGNTFRTIIETLENDLDYKVIGVTKNDDGSLEYDSKSFLRNSRDFGIPQNRPRVYIIAFSRAYYGKKTQLLPNSLPSMGLETVFSSLNDVLDKEVPEKFFLSAGYLETLEKHRVRQKEKGYGFGYRVINAPGIVNPVANTLLATGGSGRERNLIYDPINGIKYAGNKVKGKYSPINSKYIRKMTPDEWGKLQGFIGYAFLNENGEDLFSFPKGIPDAQKYKQFGNSVTIPVIKTMANFILHCLDILNASMSTVDKRLCLIQGNELRMCLRIKSKLANATREQTLLNYFNMVCHFGCGTDIHNSDIARYFGFTSARAAQIIGQLMSVGCLERSSKRAYRFRLE